MVILLVEPGYSPHQLGDFVDLNMLQSVLVPETNSLGPFHASWTHSHLETQTLLIYIYIYTCMYIVVFIYISPVNTSTCAELCL